MMGDVGAVAKAIDTVMSWILDENGMGEWRKRREGNRLERDFALAHEAWRKNPTPENRKVRRDALAALERWADAP